MQAAHSTKPFEYYTEGFKWILNWTPVMPKGRSFSKVWWKFFQSGENNTHRKSFRSLIISTRNQIVSTIFRSIWFQQTSIWIQVNRIMVNTIWFQVDLIRFRKYFSVCTTVVCCILETSRIGDVSDIKSKCDVLSNLVDSSDKYCWPCLS